MEEIGADDLMDGAEEGEEDVETDLTALLAANDFIRSTYRPREDMFTVEWQLQHLIVYKYCIVWQRVLLVHLQLAGGRRSKSK